MTVAQRSVLLIGPRPELLAKARALGLRTVAVHFPSHFTSRHAEHTDLALLGNYPDWAVLRPLAGAAAEVADIIGVLSNVEPGLEPAARCALLLGLRGNDIGATALLRDKQAMRVRLDECGFATVPWGPLTDAAALAAFGTEHGYPLIVKPVDGLASLGVNRLDGPGDIAKVLATVAQLRKDNDHRYAEFFPLRRFLVERYIHGPEFSVEAFSFDGRHLVIAVTEKLLLPYSFVEVGHALPARLAGPAEDAVVAEVTGFLDAVGIRHGATHTEVRVQDGRPHVIESHTRTGGDRIVDLVHAAVTVQVGC